MARCLLVFLVTYGATFETQDWTYNASLWWDGTVLLDSVHGPEISEIGFELTELSYAIADVAKAACLKLDATDSGTQCPINGFCDIRAVTDGILYHRKVFHHRTSQSVQRLEPLRLKQIGLQVLAVVENMAISLCEPLLHGLEQSEPCAPLILDILSLTRGISYVAMGAMAELHAAQIGIVSGHHPEILEPQPHSIFNASRGSTRAEILESLLRELAVGQQPGVMPVALRAAEVGVHDGRTSEAIFTALPSLEMLLVDPFEFADDRYFAEHTLYPERTDARTMSDQLWERLRPFRNRSVLVLQQSPKAASWASDASLDLVFIDGFHSYNAVRDDIEAWRPKLREGGVLAGHDYALFWPGVCQAVHEFCRNNKIPLMLGAEGVWWVHF